MQKNVKQFKTRRRPKKKKLSKGALAAIDITCAILEDPAATHLVGSIFSSLGKALCQHAEFTSRLKDIEVKCFDSVDILKAKPNE